jgi:hypothetical protein
MGNAHTDAARAAFYRERDRDEIAMTANSYCGGFYRSPARAIELPR